MQKEKIKVAWICHFSNSYIRDKVPINYKRILYKLARKMLGLYNKDGKNSDIAPWVTGGIQEMEKRNEIELHVISPQVGLKKLTYEFEMNGIYYHFYNPSFTLFLMHCIKNVNMWRKMQISSYFTNKFLKRIKPDIINLIGTENPYYSCTVLDIKLKVPIFVSMQTVYSNPERLKYWPESDKNLHWKIELMIHERLRYFGATGSLHRDLLLKNNPNAIVFDIQFPYPKMPSVFEVPKEYDFVNFALAHGARKGTTDSLESLSIVKKQFPKVTLNIVGGCDDKTRQDLDKMIENLDLKNNVVFTDFFQNQSDLFQHIKKSKFALLPVKLDIISGTILQAMFYELPVITYQTTGTPILNRKNECVLISDKGNINSLADNMILLLSNPQKAEILRKNAKQEALEKMDNSKIVNQLIKDYRAIINHYNEGISIPKELLFA
jgi:glycosyltransferase involved in cell wall biosynthesis